MDQIIIARLRCFTQAQTATHNWRVKIVRLPFVSFCFCDVAAAGSNAWKGCHGFVLWAWLQRNDILFNSEIMEAVNSFSQILQSSQSKWFVNCDLKQLKKPLHPLYSMINMPSYLQNSLTNLTAVLCRGGTTIGSSKFGWCLGVGWCRWQPCKEMRYYHHSKGCTIFVHEQSIIGEHGIWCVYYVAWLFASQLLNFYHPLPKLTIYFWQVYTSCPFVLFPFVSVTSSNWFQEFVMPSWCSTRIARATQERRPLKR